MFLSKTFYRSLFRNIFNFSFKSLVVFTVSLLIFTVSSAQALTINEGETVRLSDHPLVFSLADIEFTSLESSENPGILIIDVDWEPTGTFNGTGYAVFQIEEGVTLNIADRSNSAFFQDGKISFTGKGRVLFEDNTGVYGGAVYAAGGSVEFGDNATLTNNTADTHGGAVYSGGNVEFGDNALLDNNTATNGVGGAVYAENGSVSFGDNATLTGNTAFGDGGAVYSGGSVSFGDNATLTGNQARVGGAVRANANVTFGDNATLTDNTATYFDGGAVWANGSVTFGDNATLKGNTAGDLGGAVWAYDNVTFGDNATLMDNTATYGDGGAVYSVGNVEFGDNATLTNNTAGGGYGGAVWTDGSVSFGDNATLSSNTATSGNGGAVRAGGDVTFGDNATLTNNTAGAYGGAVYAENGSVEFGDNATLKGNTASYLGGAVLANANVTFGDNATLTDNTATSGNGGAVRAGGSVTFSDNATLTGNTATQDGGAVYAASGNVEFGDNATLTGNMATYGSGGAVRAGGSVSFGDNATLTDNTARSGGAVFAGGSVTFGDNATLTGNTTSFGGGAVSAGGDVEFGDNATLTGNTTSDSGGAVFAGGSVEFGDNATLTDNTAGDSGGAVWTDGSVTFNTSDGGYSLISGNLANEAANSIYFDGNNPTLTINTVGDSTVDLRDPVSKHEDATVGVSKTGSGTWLLGGSNDFGGAVNISKGTLHLYAADEVSNGYEADGTTEKNVEAGEIIADSFTLADGAALTAGGGNKVTANTISLEGGITVNAGTLELDGAVTTDGLDVSFGEGAELIIISDLNISELSGDNGVIDLGTNILTAQSGTYAGIINAGSLVKNGTGQLYLSNENAFEDGDITINGGILRLNTDTLASSLFGAGTLLIDLGNPAGNFSLTDSTGSFTGTLDIRNTGFTLDDTAEGVLSDATLVLGSGSSASADQSRTIGGLDMNGGTLTLDYGSSTVDSPLLNVGALDVTGGTVNILGETPLPVEVTVQDSFFNFTVEQAAKIVDAQAITGSSQLNVLVNGEEQATGVFDVTQNGEAVGEGFLGLVAAAGDDGLYLGGGLVALSANQGKTLTVSNEGAETDTFSIRLTGQGGFEFELTEGSSVFAGNTASDYAGSTFINGAGTFTTLTDNAFGNTDSVSVGSGVNFVLNHAVGSADLNIAAGSLLSGNGSTGGNLSLYGTIAPGNFIGTVTVGSISFEDGSVYEAEANIDGTSDKIIVTGNAALTGGSVSVLAEDGNWGRVTGFSILEAGSITGEFDGITSNLAFLTPSLSYSANEVSMTLARNDTEFFEIAATRNQRNTSLAIESLGAGSAVYDEVLGLDEDSARRAYDGLSGEIHATLLSSVLNNGRLIRSAALGRLTDISSARLTKEDSAWIKIFGLTADTDSDNNAAKYDSDGQIIIVGTDFQPAAASRFGLAFGYESSNIKVKSGRSSEADVKALHLGAYGSHNAEFAEFRAGAFFGFSDIETERRVRAGSINENLEGDYNAKSVQVFVEAGKSINLGRASVTPYINTAYVYLHADSATEDGGEAALEIDSYSEGLFTVSPGVRAEIAFSDALRIRGNAAYQRALDGDKPERSLRFASGGSSFDVRGLPLNEESFIIGLDLGYSLSDAVSFTLGYGGSFGKYINDHYGKAAVSVAF